MDRASALHLILLDGVEARLDGQVRPLGPPQRRGVLAVLAMRRMGNGFRQRHYWTRCTRMRHPPAAMR